MKNGLKDEKPKVRCRGWFPRQCSVILYEPEYDEIDVKKIN